MRLPIIHISWHLVLYFHFLLILPDWDTEGWNSLTRCWGKNVCFCSQNFNIRFFFCSFWEWKEKEEWEVFTMVRNFDTFLIRWSECWHTSWIAGGVQFFCQRWALHYPWEKLTKFGKITALWKISLCIFSSVALVDSDAAVPICVCLHHSCVG